MAVCGTDAIGFLKQVLAIKVDPNAFSGDCSQLPANSEIWDDQGCFRCVRFLLAMAFLHDTRRAAVILFSYGIVNSTTFVIKSWADGVCVFCCCPGSEVT